MGENGYTVSETVQLTGVPSHVLRYWEEELGVPVARTSQGHRIYSDADIQTFRQVKELKAKGLQLKAIRVLFEDAGTLAGEASFREQVQSIAQSPESVERTDTAGEHVKVWRQDRQADADMSEVEDCRVDADMAKAGDCQVDGNVSKVGNYRVDGNVSKVGNCRVDADMLRVENCQVNGNVLKVGNCRVDADVSEMQGCQVDGDLVKNRKRLADTDISGEPEEETVDSWDIILTEQEQDPMERFTAVLRQLLESVAEEQNRKLEQALTECIRSELSELYELYHQALQETAVSAEQDWKTGAGRPKTGKMRRFLDKILDRVDHIWRV